MPSINFRPILSKPKTQCSLFLLFFMVIALAPSHMGLAEGEEKHLAVYSARARYSVNIYDRNGQEYVDLVYLLQPLAPLDFTIEGKTWKVRAGNVEGKFKEGKGKVKIGRRDVNLGGKMLVENGRALLPLRSALQLIAAFSGMQGELQLSTHKLFLDHSAIRFTAQMTDAGGSALQIDFTSPVNPTIATDGNKLKLTFTREAIVPGDNPSFSNSLISSFAYSESNGAAEITINGNVPLIARFENGNRAIIVTAAPAKVEVKPPTIPVSPPSVKVEPVPPVVPTAPPIRPVPLGSRYMVVVDPSHGGEENGANFSSELAEKEITLSLARRLRNELQRKGIRVTLLRDSNVRISLDQRAVMANSMHPLLYVAIHAGTPGNGVRVYTSTFPSSDYTYGGFIPWEWAQGSFADRSRLAAAGMIKQLKKSELHAVQLSVAVPPLNNIAAPAIAIEMAPPEEDIAGLTSASYQQQIAVALASAIAEASPNLKDKQ